jgi:hypothetical protein
MWPLHRNKAGRATIGLVRGRVQRVFVAVLLAICIGAPMVEMFDQWDHTLQDGNDTEANLVVVVLCVGIGVLSVRALLLRTRPSRSQSRIVLPLSLFAEHVHPFVALPLPASSPPASLRI